MKALNYLLFQWLFIYIGVDLRINTREQICFQKYFILFPVIPGTGFKRFSFSKKIYFYKRDLFKGGLV